MSIDKVTFMRLNKYDKEEFIKENQRAFNYGALEEFGLRDNHFEEDGEIISRATIEESIRHGTAYWILVGEKKAGGVVVNVKGNVGKLELLFVSPNEHSKGIGQNAWHTIEEMYPQVEKWETFTPYFEMRNIHFYVNKCGFHVVEFFNEFHPLPDKFRVDEELNCSKNEWGDGMFHFEKVIKR